MQLMNSARKCVLCLIVTLLLSHSLVYSQQAQVDTPLVVASDAYEELLDRIFPRDLFARRNLAYTMILRFVPSWTPESQLVIRVGFDREVEARMYTVRGRRVSEVARAYSKPTGSDVQEMVATVDVQELVLDLDFDKVEEWHSSLYDALEDSIAQLRESAAIFRETGTIEVVLDGTMYDLWYAQGTTQNHWRFSDASARKAGDEGILALMRWMNTVRFAALEKQ